MIGLSAGVYRGGVVLDRIGVAAGAIALAFALVTPTSAAASTSCGVGGPAPGWRALSLHLPHGSAYVGLRLTGSRPIRATSTGSDWHLVQGVFVLTAPAQRLVGYQISADGAYPAHTGIAALSHSAGASAPGPNAPFVHSAGYRVAGLAPGDYTVIAFGSTGAGGASGETWGADIDLSGAHTCRVVGAGDVFDHSQADFTGGTSLTAYGAAAISDAHLVRHARRSLSVGVMQATVESVGSATLTGRVGQTTVRVTNAVAPFVVAGGRQVWTGSARGVSPVVDVTGVDVDL